MMRRVLMVGMVLLFIVALEGSQGKTIIVDDDGGSWADYSTIRNAISNSNDSDVIRIYEGSYYENIYINSSLKLIGNGTKTIITHSSDPIIEVQNESILLEGLNISSYSQDEIIGIHLLYADTTEIRNCSLSDLRSGIVSSVTPVNITNVVIRRISLTAISISGLSHLENVSTITNCVIDDVKNGIDSEDSTDFTKVIISNVSNMGIDIAWSNCSLRNVSIFGKLSDNSTGLRISQTIKNQVKIQNVNIQFFSIGINNMDYGSFVIQDSIIANNQYGIDDLSVGNFHNKIDSCQFVNNSETAIQITPWRWNSGLPTQVWGCTFINNGFNQQFQNHPQYMRGGYDTIVFHNETESGNYWSDYEGTDTDFDGIGEEDYGLPYIDKETDYDEHYPAVYPLHVSSVNDNDISIEYVGNNLESNPLRDTTFTLFLRITCVGTSAYNVPISVYSYDGDNWEIADVEAIFNDNVLTSDIPVITALANDTEVSTQYIEVKVEVSKMIGIYLNPFSKAVHNDSSFYWESDYDNNVLVIEFELVNKAKSDSATSIPNPGYVILALTTTLMMVVRKRSFGVR